MDALLNKIAEIRRQLDLPDDVVAVNSGSWGPLCRAAATAMEDAVRQDAAGRRYAPDLFMDMALGVFRRDQREVAQFLHCDPDEIADCESTTHGMNLCLWGMDWRPGDEVIAGTHENNAGRAPLIVLAQRRGIRIVYADQTDLHADSAQAVLQCITPRTRAILLSDVNCVNGRRADLKKICDVARQNGIITIIDGVQAIVTAPIHVKEIGCDAYCIARHKSACGPDGAGALYVRRESLEQFQPTFAGCFSLDEHGIGLALPTSDRFHLSTWAYYAHLGGAETLRWLREDVGIEFAYQRIAALRHRLFDNLTAIPQVKVQSLRDNSGGLLLFSRRDLESDALGKWLTAHKAYHRVFTMRVPPADKIEVCGVRMAVGFWQRQEDMDRIAELVEAAR